MPTKRKPKKNSPLDDVVERLLDLYTDCNEDRPDSVLGCYPNSRKVIDALRTLIDVLFPGKLSSRSIHQKALPAHIRRNMTSALRLLGPEIERALPFRWIGQAARHEGARDQCSSGHASWQSIEGNLHHVVVRQRLAAGVRAGAARDDGA